VAKFVIDASIDAMLAYLADCDEINVCSAQPTTYTEAITTYSLADIAVTPGNGNGDFTIANACACSISITPFPRESR